MEQEVPEIGDQTMAGLEAPAKGPALGNAPKGISHLLPEDMALETGGVNTFKVGLFMYPTWEEVVLRYPLQEQSEGDIAHMQPAVPESALHKDAPKMTGEGTTNLTGTGCLSTLCM